MEANNHVTLSFTCDLEERTEWEIEKKGWFEQAVVNLPDGSNIPVCFWDPVRLLQDLESDLKAGKTCIAEPAMIIVPRVTVDNMTAAVQELYRRGYFDCLKALFK